MADRNCIQCNQCSYVCPHATIRPFLLNEEEMREKPDTFETKEAAGKGLEGGLSHSDKSVRLHGLF